MIIGGLSSTFMLLLDRIMLSHFSEHAMNAAFASSQSIEMILLPLLSFATFSEVFVGQFNGAKQWRKTSVPIAQIAIFLCICWLVVYPFAVKIGQGLLPEVLYQEGYPYFIIGLLTIPFQIIFSAISAFFVGTRRPQIVLYGVFSANIVNVLLDWLLIFGWWKIPAMGATGAALASLIAMALSAVLLLWFFLMPMNALHYNTRHFTIDKRMLIKNIWVALPFAFSECIETFVWAGLVKVLAYISISYVTVQTVCVTLWIFLMFITDGLQKGVMALSSNCIGAERDFLIKKLVYSMARLSVIFAIIAFFPLVVFSESILKYGFNITSAADVPVLKTALFLVWIVMTMTMMTSSCLGGILSSGGDTKFITLVRLSSIILCIALPILYFFKAGTLTGLTSWWLCILQQVFNGAWFFWRYKSQKWKKNFTSGM